MKVYEGENFEIVSGYSASYNTDELGLVTLQVAGAVGDVWKFSTTRDKFPSLIYEVRDALRLMAQGEFQIEGHCARIDRKDGEDDHQVILFPDGMPCNPIYWTAENPVAAIFKARYQCRAQIEALHAASKSCICLDEWENIQFAPTVSAARAEKPTSPDRAA